MLYQETQKSEWPLFFFITTKVPLLKLIRQCYKINFTIALETSLLGELFMFRTIFHPWVLSSNEPAAGRSLFTNKILVLYLMQRFK